ncbi:hypothetical protein JCM18694_30310 [Prolixibacter denitrificans]|uniref:Uncharacterized protein n=1 Tax=Prolixibacter denitrificans TaxID=1541063 RepID=A0ABQ0ZNA7_9BACT|nr:hypothetical protein JCM18694_30310 [Prolixibacter denitrificans]
MVAKNPENIPILQYGDILTEKKAPGVKLSSVTQPEMSLVSCLTSFLSFSMFLAQEQRKKHALFRKLNRDRHNKR